MKFNGGDTVQIWKCSGCGHEAAFGSEEPPGATGCLDCRSGFLEKSRTFTLPPKPSANAFFHWGEMRWKEGE